uniref:Uncharacterized protein n=1 Tax=Rhizophagus irregularis (strain DAOM 181602 / DAOM 197198 / MUCL 43194) TaxID=747089 RepID=U9T2K6_RHIID
MSSSFNRHFRLERFCKRAFSNIMIFSKFFPFRGTDLSQEFINIMGNNSRWNHVDKETM